MGNIVQILLGLAKSYFNIKGKTNTSIQVRPRCSDKVVTGSANISSSAQLLSPDNQVQVPCVTSVL